MTESDVMDRVRDFVALSFLHLHPDVELTDDYPLLESRLLDSMAVMEVVAFLEEEFGIVVDEEDIVGTTLGTLRSIAGYVVARRGAGAT